MFYRAKFASLWVITLLAAFLMQVACPQRMQLGPPEELHAQSPAVPEGPDPAQVRHFGCEINRQLSPAAGSGQVGWRVDVWADYSIKPPGAPRDWRKWLSFRQGKNADEKAQKDCREWMRALRKRLPQPEKKPDKENGK